MDDFLDQLDLSLKTKLYYLSLFGALAVPDIAASLDAPDGRTNQKRYEAWFDQHMSAQYPDVKGADCYFYRCSMLHQGSQRLAPKSPKAKPTFNRVLFLEPGNTFVTIHNSIFGDAWVIDLPTFCHDMIAAAQLWLASARTTQLYQANQAKFITRHIGGLAPYINGPTVIG